jgi:hypothetical protein
VQYGLKDPIPGIGDILGIEETDLNEVCRLGR